MCRLCVSILINKLSFQPFMCLDFKSNMLPLLTRHSDSPSQTFQVCFNVECSQIPHLAAGQLHLAAVSSAGTNFTETMVYLKNLCQRFEQVIRLL